MSQNPFVPSISVYKRDIVPMSMAVQQLASGLAVIEGIPFAQALDFVKNSIDKSSITKVRDPEVTYLQRLENGDRQPQTCKLTQYLQDTMDRKEIIAPSGTTYLNPNVQESFLVKFIDKNVAKRKKAKKASFQAKARRQGHEKKAEEAKLAQLMPQFEQEMSLANIAGIEELFEDGNQRNRKLSNNAISGSHASSSTPLYNQTGHSSLTSNCRMTSGYGNANNEKLLMGNRHYWRADIAINNIASITTHTDYDLLQKVMVRYQLHYPTAQETMDVIHYSSDLYWMNSKKSALIRQYVERLTPLQRAAFVYTGDLYHVRKFNEGFMRGFIGAISARKEGKVEGAIEKARKFNEDYAALGNQICSDLVKSLEKNYEKMEKEGVLDTVVSTIANVENVLDDYADFIRATMVTDNVPASVPHFPKSIRRSALTSDTDSTIFTVQDWVQWYFGDIRFDTQAIAVGATMVFIASQAIIHVLARFSRNAGIVDERLYQIAMKNEYYFPLFVPTQEAKHYYALKTCQEGNVFVEPETEIKGVHLKSSNAPKHISKAAAELMVNSMKKVMAGEKLVLRDILKHVADQERDILAGLRRGDPVYYRMGQIQTPQSYTAEPERSPYAHHLFWEEVMAPKYGSYGEPPYEVIKLSTQLKTPTDTTEWLANLKDRELAERAQEWMKRYGKKQIPSIQLPLMAVQSGGIPAEILESINTRKMVSDLSAVFYKILETMGFYMLNKHATRLVSDEY